MYFILETQVNNGVGAMLPAQTRDTQNEAESVYHTILSFAATSSVEHHGAIILDENCIPIMHKSYTHEVENNG